VNVKEAIKTVLLAGHYVSLNSNFRITPTTNFYVVKDYLHWSDSESFPLSKLDEAIDRYLELTNDKRCRPATD
jgi:hypothetical protein